MTFRKQLLTRLEGQSRSVSSIAREFGRTRRDVEEDLLHLIRSVRAAGRFVTVVPARCRVCGFTFDEHRLSKPGKCPACRGTRVFEPQIRVEPADHG